MEVEKWIQTRWGQRSYQAHSTSMQTLSTVNSVELMFLECAIGEKIVRFGENFKILSPSYQLTDKCANVMLLWLNHHNMGQA